MPRGHGVLYKSLKLYKIKIDIIGKVLNTSTEIGRMGRPLRKHGNTRGGRCIDRTIMSFFILSRNIGVKGYMER